MNRSQLRRAAEYLEIDAEVDLNSHAVRRDGGGVDWPDDTGVALGSMYRQTYKEKLSLAKGLRKLARSVPSATKKAPRRRVARG